MLNVLKKKTEVLHRILNEINAKKKKRSICKNSGYMKTTV